MINKRHYICDFCQKQATNIKRGTSIRKKANGDIVVKWNGRDTFYCNMHVPQIEKIEDYDVYLISYE